MNSLSIISLTHSVCICITSDMDASEDQRIDDLSEILFKFERNKARLVSGRPTQLHNLRDAYYLDSPFSDEELKNATVLDLGLASKDIPSDLRISAVGGSGHGTIISICGVNKTDKKIVDRLNYKKAFFCEKVYEVFLITFGELGEDSSPVGGTYYIGLQGDNKIILNKPDRDYHPLMKEKLVKWLPLYASHHHIMDYRWHASIRADRYGLQIPIHPATARFFFKNRDKSFGSTRKASIRNFVLEHNRYIKSKPDPILIKKHLRGAVKFQWMGFEVEVAPSAFDLRELNR